MIRDPGDDTYDLGKLAAPLSQSDGHSILQMMLLNQILVQTALIAIRRNDMAMVDVKLQEIESARKDSMLFMKKFEDSLKPGDLA